MKALITGASGFLGSHLADLLLARGDSVRVLLRTTSSLKWLQDQQIERVPGDLFNKEALQSAVTGVDYVYHLAGVTKAKRPEEYFLANQQGTRNLLDAAREHAPNLRRFLHVSSQTAVGPSPSPAPIDENAPARPITTYGKSKWGAEQECQKFFQHIPITIARPPAVFGPRDRDVFEFFNTVNRRLLPIVGFSDKYISLIHSSDLVRGFVQAAESPKSIGGTYFLSSARPYTWKEVGDCAARVIGKRALRIRLPEPLVYAVAAVAEGLALFSNKAALINFEKARDMVQDYWTCDSTRATQDFGYRQELSLEEGVRNTVQWYRAQGWMT
jgi:dihydroflavonol-4-reductase